MPFSKGTVDPGLRVYIFNGVRQSEEAVIDNLRHVCIIQVDLAIELRSVPRVGCQRFSASAL